MTNYSQGSSSLASRVKFAVISCGSTQWLRQLAAIREIRRTDVNSSKHGCNYTWRARSYSISLTMT